VTVAVTRLETLFSMKLLFAAMLAFDSQVRGIFYRWRGCLDAELRASGQTLARASVMTLAAHECDPAPRELALQLSVKAPFWSACWMIWNGKC
jgi:hypothetical protein